MNEPNCLGFGYLGSNRTRKERINSELSIAKNYRSRAHSRTLIASRVSPGQVSKVKLKNLSSSPVGYKFKTNAPMKYSVKPVLGVLAPDESVKIFVEIARSKTIH
ncbi:hypothetical protein BGZ96_011247 [Linnemannia gamsii]|uniref:MSP domain-containing protein n=1 Tax=Linnemannia gamsii TaxID=64522 RepID=A0ABQ7KDZ0_9FUNG|nr:hypothetical protein BGZ96_011247 [Linnemannia gamsii]